MKTKKQFGRLISIAVTLCLCAVLPFSSAKTASAEGSPLLAGTAFQGYLSIPTYDGSGQLTHPQVQYFKDGYNGYKFWMVMTPYPGGNDWYENPSIICSNDGINWVVPDGVKNPISGEPENVQYGAHYSDSALMVKDGGFEVWYRLNPAKDTVAGHHSPNNSINIIYRQTSPDGIHWTAREEVLPNDGVNAYMSPSVIYENGKYRVWYINYDGFMYYRESADAHTWSDRVKIPLPGFSIQAWHAEVRKTDLGYEMILDSVNKAQASRYELYHGISADGITFDRLRIIDHYYLNPSASGYQPYKTSFVKIDGYYYIYTPYFGPAWHLFLTKVSYEDFKTLGIPTVATGASSGFSADDDSGYLTGLSLKTDVTDFLKSLLNKTSQVSVYAPDGSPYTAGIMRTGMTVTASFYGYKNQTLSAVVYGDVNGSGSINATDVLLVKRHVLNLETLSGAYLKAGNVTCHADGTVTASDVLAIKRHVLGLAVIQPAGGTKAAGN